MRYPKIGEKFYWLDEDNNIHELICLDIEYNNDPDIETIYCDWISDNGNSLSFISEYDIIDPDSDEVKKFVMMKEKEIWEEFFTDERINELTSIIDNSVIQDDLIQFIKNKIQ